MVDLRVGLADLKDQLEATYKIMGSYENKISELNQEINILQNQIKQKQEDRSDFQDSFRELQKRAELLETEIEKHKNQAGD